MKFTVTFKTPDTVMQALEKVLPPAIQGSIEEEELYVYKVDKLVEFTAKWVKYGECITIEFDTEAGTATVVPKN